MESTQATWGMQIGLAIVLAAAVENLVQRLLPRDSS